MTATLLIATGNAHKIEEYAELLPGVPLRSLADFAPMAEVVEDAPDFIGNAALKALAAYEHTGMPCLADDSGLEVAALDWAPGIRSARYVPGSDADRMHAVLAATADTDDRRARFTCAIAVAGLHAGTVLPEGCAWFEGCVVCVGTVDGVLTRTPRGVSGFGYDPIFELPEGRTAAELSSAEKHAISHRGVAVRAIAPLLTRVFAP